MSQKSRKTGSVADNVKVTVPFGGFDPTRLITDRSADRAEYPGLPLDAYHPTSRAGTPGLPARPGAQPAAQPPRAGVMGVMGAPAAGMAGLLRSLVEQPGDLKAGLTSAATELGKAPFQAQPLTPSQVLRDRGIDVGAVPSMALDMFLDPTNLVGGDPTDVAKAAIAGGPMMAKAASRLYSRIAEEVLPRLSKSQHPNKVRSVLKSFASSDEVAETGLEAFLQAKGDKPVTLEELETFVKDNPFSVRETHLGVDPNATKTDEALKRAKTLDRQISPVTVWIEDLDESDSARALIEQVHEQPGVEDFADLYMGAEADAARPLWTYDSTGRKRAIGTGAELGELSDPNYVYVPREVARLLPDGANDRAMTLGDLARSYNKVLTERADLDAVNTLDSRVQFAGAPKYEKYTLPGEKRDYRETLLQLPESVPKRGITPEEDARVKAIVDKAVEKIRATPDPDHPVDPQDLTSLEETQRDQWAYMNSMGYVESGRSGNAPSHVDLREMADAWKDLGAINDDERDAILNWSEKNWEHAVASKRGTTRFQEPHFPGDPGRDAFLHIRHDVRTVDGADALHIEEVQSTWDQKASERVQEAKETIREYEKRVAQHGQPPDNFRDAEVKRAREIVKHAGYKRPERETAALAAKRKELGEQWVGAVDAFIYDLTKMDPGYGYAKNWGRDHQFDLIEALERKQVPLTPDLQTKRQQVLDLSKEGHALEAEINADIALTPHQPFRGTKATEVGVKRMLLEAADRGIDQVTWTTGRQQAQRYNNLLTDIKRVEWKPETGQLVLNNSEDAWRNGRTIDGVTEKTLKDYLGKENADRLLASKARPKPPKYEVKALADVRPVRSALLTDRQLHNWHGTYEGMDDFIEEVPLDADATSGARAAESTGDRPRYKVTGGYVVEPGSHSQAQEYADFWKSNSFDAEAANPAGRVYKTREEADAAVKAHAEQMPEKYLLDTSDAPLEVGSRGMDQQYDEVMVAQFNKLGKAYGAKAEKVPLSGMASIDEKAFVIEEGEDGGRRSVYYVNTDDVPEWARDAADEMFSGTEYKSKKRAEEAVQDFIDSLSNEDGREYINANVKDTDYVWRFRIPEKMREALLTRGLPLMALAPLAAGLRNEKP